MICKVLFDISSEAAILPVDAGEKLGLYRQTEGSYYQQRYANQAVGAFLTSRG